MSKVDIIRAWKDEEYRNSLSPAQRARVPEHPAGMIELADDELQAAVGGARWHSTLLCSWYECTKSHICEIVAAPRKGSGASIGTAVATTR